MNGLPPLPDGIQPRVGETSDPDLMSSLREQDGQAQPDWDAMEQRLLEAFADQQAARDSRRWRWAAVAAMLVLSAGAWWQFGSSDRLISPTSSHLVPSGPPAATTPVPSTVTAPLTAPLAVTARMRPPRTRSVAAAAAEGPVDPLAAFAGFVALPDAGALPDFESGHIVRIELAIADTASAPIEADLLVGQDGVPRAIRLASTNQ